MIRRTALITAASVTGVVVAGAAVVGANVSILDSAASEGIGELSATTTGQEVVLEMPDESQTYAVDTAGTVTVDRYGGELSLGGVTEAPGWTHVISQQDSSILVLEFTDGSTTFRFLAVTGPDGSISAGVSEPATEVVVAPGSASAPPTRSVPIPSAEARSTSSTGTRADIGEGVAGYPRDDDDEPGDSDHEDREDGEHDDEHEEHEGGDDDD